MQSSNYNSLATKFIANAYEFSWLPLFLLKWLPLQPSLHSLTIATQILELASTDNLDCQFKDWNPQAKKLVLKNRDIVTSDYVIISERTIKYIWREWKYIIFAPNSRARKGRMETIISLPTEMLAINRLLKAAYGINWGPMLRTII